MKMSQTLRLARSLLLCGAAFLLYGGLGVAIVGDQSINSTSQNRSTQAPGSVVERPLEQMDTYRIVAANDLGMHCGDLDQRIASILPPFNVLHAQVIRKGLAPKLLDNTQVDVVYSASSNPNDPALAKVPGTSIYKTNFWDINGRTSNPLGFDAFNAYYPPGVLSPAAVTPDSGLPVPDLQRLYLGDGSLAADQQRMPSAVDPNGYLTQAYSANVPQPFALYYRSVPFFIKFPFGYTLTKINWFSAEGIPATPFDDKGRSNPYPLMRVQAMAVSGNTLGLVAGRVLSSLDTVTPVSGEVSCGICHTSSADGGNGLATRRKGFPVATSADDPKYKQVPAEVSLEYAYDLNILRLHDLRHGTDLEHSTPVSCQRCHYTPALDLAHVGPKGPADADANTREQTTHQTFSRVMHNFHGKLQVGGKLLFPSMPSPVGRSIATRDSILNQTCYTCHPGMVTQCFRGAMYNGGSACQDCHGNMSQVGNDFSKQVTQGGTFILAGDYYTNPSTPRVPWANEPACQSCHTGDVLNNLSASSGAVKSPDGIRLLQAFRTTDASAKPIVAVNRRFAENQSAAKQVLYRLSTGHGGVFCEGCHGSTHAEWPNKLASANDNVAATQLQGHTGTIVECTTCHGATSFPLSSFQRNFTSEGWMKGPHGMHPVNDSNWNKNHKEVFEDGGTPAGNCQACHGQNLQGSVLSRVAADRNLLCAESTGCRETSQGKRILLAKGTQVSCSLCHENPLNHH